MSYFRNSLSLFQLSTDKMERLKISDVSNLEGLKKQVCSECGRKRRYFCYNCKIYMPDVERIVPRLEVEFLI